MENMNGTTQKQALVIFSGGQDSTTCLIQSIQKYGAANTVALSFSYGQRHGIELERAAWIAKDLGVEHHILDAQVMGKVTTNALMDESQTIKEADAEDYPNTFVDGRNALFLLLAGIFAKSKDIRNIILGVCETDFSGYPDCRDVFVKSMNVTLNLAMDYNFNVETPLMYLTKAQTWELADQLGCLAYIEEHTHTCYMGVPGGCGECPSCKLRNAGQAEYLNK